VNILRGEGLTNQTVTKRIVKKINTLSIGLRNPMVILEGGIQVDYSNNRNVGILVIRRVSQGAYFKDGDLRGSLITNS
jgi:hypothetical protein